MTKVKLLLCAEGVVIDQKSNNVSIFNILEQINVEMLPAIIPKMVILSVLEKDESDDIEWKGEYSISIDGKEMGRKLLKHNFRGFLRSRNIMVVAGLPLPKPGTLEIALLKEEKKLASYTIEISAPKNIKELKVKATKTSGQEVKT